MCQQAWKPEIKKCEGFIVGTRWEEGCNIGKAPAPRRSWSITSPIKTEGITGPQENYLALQLKNESIFTWPLQERFTNAGPRSKLGVSLWVPKDRGEDGGGEEGLVPPGQRRRGCGGLEGLCSLLIFSSQLLLMNFHGVTDKLRPFQAMPAAVNRAALHSGVCKKTNTGPVRSPRYF